jgi:hypothetical protein
MAPRKSAALAGLLAAVLAVASSPQPEWDGWCKA